jgi:hypothetical protein
MSGFYTDPDFLEQIHAGVFTLLQTAKFVGGLQFNTALRVVDTPDDVPVAAQPALYMVQGPITATQNQAFVAARWESSVVAVVYFRADGSVPSQQQVVPDTVANNFIWGIFQAVNPGVEKQTLGGIAYHCWIDGTIVPAVAEDQVILTIPLKILF